jgi:hypothetical protein
MLSFLSSQVFKVLAGGLLAGGLIFLGLNYIRNAERSVIEVEQLGKEIEKRSEIDEAIRNSPSSVTDALRLLGVRQGANN